MQPPAPKLAAPLVLVHGLCGFNKLKVFRRPIKEYFPGIRQLLEAAGNLVLCPRVSPTAGVARRAAELKKYLDGTLPGRAVHLIGHSMGGLDARYMISRLGMESRVLSLTTVGTPHRGTTFADWGMKRFARWVIPTLTRLGIPYDAFIDLTTDACRRLNEEMPNVPGVRYYSVAGLCEKPWLGLEWQVPHRIVNKTEGPNDGVVSVASATWGEHTEVWAGDHLNLVNWPNRKARRKGVWVDRAPNYGNLLRRLADAGFAA